MAAHHPKTASLSSEERACRDSARPRQALPVPSPTFEEGESRSELAAQGHAIGARLAGEADEQLVRGRREAKRRGRCDRTERPRPLQRHVGADLVISLVEQILPPKLDPPAAVAPIKTDAPVEDREAVLHLFDVEVRPGVGVTLEPRIEIDERA